MGHYSINFNQLSSKNQDRLQVLAKEILSRSISAPNWKIVLVNSKSGFSVRRAPGASQLEAKIGTEAFELIGALVSVGIDAYEDSQRSDLKASQKIGRTSISLLQVNPIINYAFLGATLYFGSDKVDQFKSDVFSDKDPVVDFLADEIVKIGGKRFQDWSVSQSWLDF